MAQNLFRLSFLHTQRLLLLLMTKHILSMLRDKSLLIFDFDGTIANSSPVHARAYEQILQPLSVKYDYTSIAGLKTSDAISLILSQAKYNASAETVAKLSRDKQLAYAQLAPHHLTLFPDADWFLRWSYNRFRLAIATSGSRSSVSLSLDVLGISHFFETIVYSDDVQRAKPFPDLFTKVLSQTKTPPGQSLIFEDSKAGLEAAAASRVTAIHVNPLTWTSLRSTLSKRLL